VVVSSVEMASRMLDLQNRGCHNINFVTPSHFLPQILETLPPAVEAGLRLPLVWNCGGYESLEAMRIMEGIVDIFMPDYKFSMREPAEKYCRAPDYPEVIGEALREMQRQVGDLEMDAAGIARRGLLIRHLVMPGHPENTRRALEFIAAEISPEAYVNIMDQYRPAFEAGEFPEISRRLTGEEYREALSAARRLGLHRGFSDREFPGSFFRRL
jgi:putative pyruvate formate lyase activating enzyme